jgi:uncharacterized lipoprotein YajG
MTKFALAVLVIAFGGLMLAGCPTANNAKPSNTPAPANSNAPANG